MNRGVPSVPAADAGPPSGDSESLWRNGRFLNLWGAQTLSQFGNQVNLIALPLAAVALGASPLQMGALGALQYAPYLVFGLPVGVWADRVRRRPLLVAASLGRTLILLILPISALLGVLRLGTLFATALLVGSLAIVFDVAYTALLPSLVRREQIVGANSRLNSSLSLAQITGPGAAGILVQLLTAPIAITADAFAFLVSAVLIGRIRARETVARTRRLEVRRDIVEGLRAVWGQPVLRALTMSTVNSNVFVSVNVAVFVLYLVRVQSLSPALIGLVYSVGSVGGLFGSVAAPHVARRFGIGRTLIVSLVVIGLGATATALPVGPPLVAAAGLALTFGVWQVASGIFAVNNVSLRQVVTPDRLQGRVQASVRTFTWGVAPPAGYLLGGFLGQFLDLRLVLVIAGMGLTAASGWLVASPIPGLREASDAR